MAYYCNYNSPPGFVGGTVINANYFSNPDVTFLGERTSLAGWLADWLLRFPSATVTPCC